MRVEIEERERHICKYFNQIFHLNFQRGYLIDHLPARWRNCVDWVSSNFGNVLGRMYIEENFNRTAFEDVRNNKTCRFKSFIVTL